MPPTPPIRLEPLDDAGDGRRRAGSVEHNRDDILAVLQRVLPARGTVLEVASGTGEHALHFARALPHLVWQPTDRDAEGLASIAAWRAAADLPNIPPPLALDITAPDWPIAEVDAVVAINLLHITPWNVTEALLAGAGRVLRSGAPLVVYGAMLRDGIPTAESNLEFDERLRAADPSYGVRRLEDVVRAATPHGLALDTVVEMPHENVTVVLRAR